MVAKRYCRSLIRPRCLLQDDLSIGAYDSDIGGYSSDDEFASQSPVKEFAVLEVCSYIEESRTSGGDRADQQ